MTSKIRKWPLDWHVHVAKFCELYFDGKDVVFEDKLYWSSISTHDLEKTTYHSINLKFHIKEHPYMVSISNNGSHFSCSVFFRHLCAFEPFLSDDGVYVCCSGDLAIPEDVAGIGGHGLTVVEIMNFAEQSMINDHERRSDDGWDNDDEENDPIEPFSPSSDLINTPELLGV